MIYAGAQKNIGPAGVTIVIVREDLLGNALPITPSVLNYQIMAKENSLYNTPSCFAYVDPSLAYDFHALHAELNIFLSLYRIYSVGLVFDWILENGGVEEMERRAIDKSERLYKIIDSSNGYYSSPVNPDCRSRMNVPFRVKKDEALENQFVKEAKAEGLLGLKGHRSVGGIRASIYNAVLPSHVEKLEQFMLKFAASKP